VVVKKTSALCETSLLIFLVDRSGNDACHMDMAAQYQQEEYVLAQCGVFVVRSCCTVGFRMKYVVIDSPHFLLWPK